MEKRCHVCKELKSINEFCKDITRKDGYAYICKICLKKRHKEYYGKNRDKMLVTFSNWYKNNKEKKKAKNLLWRNNNPIKVKEQSKRAHSLRQSTPLLKLNSYVSHLLWWSLKNNKNGQHWESSVNFNLYDLKTHLESLFKDEMSWENYSYYGWHIDHIIPISLWKFRTSEDREFKQCWALANLQPLWGKENMRKNNKLRLEALNNSN